MMRRTVAATAALLSAAVLAACGTTVAGTGVVGSAPVVSSDPGITAPPSTAGPTDPTSGPSTPESTGAPSTSSSSTSESSETSQSTATGSPDPSTATTAGPDDDSLYPTTPRPIAETPSSQESAATLEGRRMAAYVLLPTDYNPSYHVSGGGFGTAPMKSGQSLSTLFFDSPVPAVADRYGMIAGFHTARNDEDGDNMVICVMEFPDDKTAATASKQLSEAARTKQQDTHEAKIAGMPTAYGWQGRYEDQDSRYLHTFYASGSMVIYLWMETGLKSTKYLHDEFPKIYAKQVSLLKDFKPVPKDQLMQQKVDPSGLLARTLPAAPGEGTVLDGYYSPRGFLHLTLDPPEDQKLYPEAGVDLVARAGSTVYRAKDAAGAEMVVDNFVDQIAKDQPKMKDMEPPPGADYAKCLEDTLAANYYCVAAYGRYAVELSGGDEASMGKAVAAQGELLKGF